MRHTIAASAELPTRFGQFQIVVFNSDGDRSEHVAMVKGDVRAAHDVPVWIHAGCLIGDTLGSCRCDCQAKLQSALAIIGASSCGIVLYLRGIIRLGNEALCAAADKRDDALAASMLRALGVRSVTLMSDTPQQLREVG